LQLIYVLQKLVRLLSANEETVTVKLLPDFLLTAEIDNINLYKLLEFSTRTRLANKLRGYLQKFEPSVSLPDKPKVKAGVSSFLQKINKKDEGVQEVAGLGKV